MQKKVLFFENLDGLRFFAFLSVFLRHSFHTDFEEIKANSIYQFVSNFFIHGNLGVNFFFVLSGFLITFLLLNEQKIEGRINIPNFYIRRTLRIWPLYFMVVMIGYYAFPQLKLLFGKQPEETANLLYYLTFLCNFDMINSGLPDSSILSVLWSVAIEEQFYLVWPWLIFLLKPKHYPYIFAAIIVASLTFRAFHLYDNPHILKFHTLSQISDMAMGGIFSYLCFYYQGFIEFFQRLKRSQIIIVYLAGFMLITFSAHIFTAHAVLKTSQNLILSFFFGFIILEQNYARNSFVKMKDWKFISKLGQWSYGLYCLHFVGILTTTTLSGILGWNTTVAGVLIFETILALVITIIISYISFRWYEKPFLRLKAKFSTITRK